MASSKALEILPQGRESSPPYSRFVRSEEFAYPFAHQGREGKHEVASFIFFVTAALALLVVGSAAVNVLN